MFQSLFGSASDVEEGDVGMVGMREMEAKAEGAHTVAVWPEGGGEPL